MVEQTDGCVELDIILMDGDDAFAGAAGRFQACHPSTCHIFPKSHGLDLSGGIWTPPKTASYFTAWFNGVVVSD